MLTEITNKDINELKRISKANKSYEIFALPFILLFNIPVESKLKDQIYKEYQYWTSLKKYMIKQDFFRQISDIEVETIPTEKYRKLEDIVLDERFSLEIAEKLSDCVYKLAKWTIGIVEIHKFLRRYSLSKLDYELLNNDEIRFCNQLDKKHISCYKILRFINKFLEKDTFEDWKEKIKEVMQQHDVSFLKNSKNNSYVDQNNQNQSQQQQSSYQSQQQQF